MWSSPEASGGTGGAKGQVWSTEAGAHEPLPGCQPVREESGRQHRRRTSIQGVLPIWHHHQCQGDVRGWPIEGVRVCLLQFTGGGHEGHDGDERAHHCQEAPVCGPRPAQGGPKGPTRLSVQPAYRQHEGPDTADGSGVSARGWHHRLLHAHDEPRGGAQQLLHAHPDSPHEGRPSVADSPPHTANGANGCCRVPVDARLSADASPPVSPPIRQPAANMDQTMLNIWRTAPPVSPRPRRWDSPPDPGSATMTRLMTCDVCSHISNLMMIIT